MSFSFPSNPTLNQTSVQNGRTYTWSGYAWELLGNITGHASTHAANGSDPLTLTSAQISDFNSAVQSVAPSTPAELVYTYATTNDLPGTGDSTKLYIVTDTNRMYRWTGSLYVEVGPPVASVNNAQVATNLYLWSNFR